MSYAFITALKANPEQSYVELLNSIRDILEKDYSQKPQLSCSHPLGMSTLPFFSVAGEEKTDIRQTPTFSSSCERNATHGKSSRLWIE